MKKIMRCLTAVALMMCMLSVLAYSESQDEVVQDEASLRKEYLETELIGTWEDFLSVTEVAIMEDGICYLIDPYGNAVEYRYLLAEDIPTESADYLMSLDNPYAELSDGTKMGQMEYYQYSYSLEGFDIAIFDMAEVQRDDASAIMLGYFIAGTHPNNYAQEDYLMVYYIDDYFGYDELRGASLSKN